MVMRHRYGVAQNNRWRRRENPEIFSWLYKVRRKRSPEIWTIRKLIM